MKMFFFFVYLFLCLCLFCLILLFDQVIMSVPTVRELNCSKSLGEIANLDFSVPVDCFAMYMLVSRYAGQSCHSSPTCRKTCLCMDRIHLSLQEMMTLKPVNEVDAIIKFMLFLCQVSSGMICCCLLLIYSRLFLSLYYFISHVIWRNLMAPFSVLRNLVPVSVLMLFHYSFCLCHSFSTFW